MGEKLGLKRGKSVSLTAVIEVDQESIRSAVESVEPSKKEKKKDKKHKGKKHEEEEEEQPAPPPPPPPPASQGYVESCPGCMLDGRRDLKKFLYKDVPKYNDIRFKKGKGIGPQLVLCDEDGNEQERVPLEDMNRKQCNALLVEKGFQLKAPYARSRKSAKSNKSDASGKSGKSDD